MARSSKRLSKSARCGRVHRNVAWATWEAEIKDESEERGKEKRGRDGRRDK